MVQFVRLRLSGFKSFVESTEVPIEPGLTGVVGPNGCGKSNLVEALRWVMGEHSARQMRGGEMDDVIFGGTANRPARNVAEVVLHLDNRRRLAPALFNAHDELEVARRIERGDGSLYRVNGREARARDVQLLFADAATGARSTAMVSQGRIGAIIAAKPSDRRSLLEEAAGIGGLHSRRHEAELRLRGAETNLERLEDVLAALDGQLQNLKRQARQAARYRGLSEQIRTTEAVILHLRWVRAIEALEQARSDDTQSQAKVVELTAAAAAAGTAQDEAAAALPELRQAEAEEAARLHRLSVAREQLDAEERRLAEARRDLERRLTQAAVDLERETARAADAVQAMDRLGEERVSIETAQAGEAAVMEAAAARLSETQAEAVRLESELAGLSERLAAVEVERAAVARRIDDAEARRRRAAERLREAEDQRQRALAESVPEDELAASELRVETATELLEQAREEVGAADSRRRDAQAARDAAREDLQGKAAAHARLRAEANALADLLAAAAPDGRRPVLDELTVAPGYEAALAAAVGEDLSAPATDDPAPVRWNTLPPLAAAPLPAGIQPLSELVRAPAALARRLSQTGLVADAALGCDLRHELAAGQRLVSRDGDLWRWDGFTVAAGAPSAAAARLRQRNRLRELRADIEDAEPHMAAAEARVEQAAAAADQAAARENQARDRVRQMEAALTQTRDTHARLAHKAAAAASRLAALDDAMARLAGDLREAEAEVSAALAAQAAFTDGAADRSRQAELRAELAERRTAVIEARSVTDRLQRETAERRRRLTLLDQEVAAWRERAEAARRHREDLGERREAVREDLERLAARPLEIAEQRGRLLDDLERAGEARRGAADGLAAAERHAAQADARRRAAEQALATAREARVRQEAAVEAARQLCRGVAQRIHERLECTPEQLRGQPGIAEADPDGLAELERRLERQGRERENMGPVNLRAEQEAAELEAQITVLQAERADVVAAIAKLRHAVAEINREGRERLLASFEQVDEHFRRLFVRLFGGGRAHLSLTESADPLAAGLEIMASPPGKRLQILSLLSGGEQALTALALLFAVFLTNPAPICVLDEVDAPLDDANVDRFCSLVAEIARSSSTRFLIVTHHRMTMARMDRLFGVTMVERGVSRLVSVDLQTAEGLHESA